jgi:hypothetical protein
MKKNDRSKNEGKEDKTEISQLNAKLKDLEDLCSKLKKSNESMKADYEKHKLKLSKVPSFYESPGMQTPVYGEPQVEVVLELSDHSDGACLRVE